MLKILIYSPRINKNYRKRLRKCLQRIKTRRYFVKMVLVQYFEGNSTKSLFSKNRWASIEQASVGANPYFVNTFAL